MRIVKHSMHMGSTYDEYDMNTAMETLSCELLEYVLCFYCNKGDYELSAGSLCSSNPFDASGY